MKLPVNLLVWFVSEHLPAMIALAVAIAVVVAVGVFWPSRYP